MSASGTLAMRRRLPGAGVGQDGPNVEPGYGIVMPSQILNKAISVNAFIQAVDRDIVTHQATLGPGFMNAWKAFMESWVREFDSVRNSFVARLWGNTMTLILEKEAMARRFRLSFEQRTGLTSSVPDIAHRSTITEGLQGLAPFAIPTAAIVAIVAVVGGVLVFKTMK